MERALIVAFHFAPENTSGTHRSLHFARCLTDEGVDVTVLTRSLASIPATDPALNGVFPWPERIVRVAAEDTGFDRLVAKARRILAPGRRQPTTSGTGGTKSTAPAGPMGSSERSPAPDSLRQSSNRRFKAARSFLDWAQKFPDVHKGWYQPAVREGRELVTRQPFDMIFASGPPWTGLLVGAKLAAYAGVPFIAGFRDPWTRRSGRVWSTGGPLFDFLGARIEERMIGSAALVMANSPGISAAIREGYPSLDESGVVTILNGSDARRRSITTPFPTSADLVARHFGSLYAGRRIAPLLEAAAARAASGANWIVEQYGPAPADVDIEGVDPTVAGRLAVRTPLPFREAVEQMHEPGLLIMIQPAILSRQVPTKLYDYLCAGNPVLLLTTEDSAAWQIASRFDRAWRADPEDIRGIAAVLAGLEERHRAGELRQVATDEDTAALTKQSIGAEFIRFASRVARPAQSP